MQVSEITKCGQLEYHPQSSNHVINSMIQTDLDLSSTVVSSEAGVHLAKNVIDIEPSKKTTGVASHSVQVPKSASITLANEHSMVNPIELRFRERTRSNSSLPFTSDLGLTPSGEANDSLLPNMGVSGKIARIQKYFRGAVSAVKSATRSKNEESSDEDEEVIGNQGIRLRSSRQARVRRDFLQIKLVQEMKNEHTGAIWAMRFSPCGRLLATAGYDRDIRIWVLRHWYDYFKKMQQRFGLPTNANTNVEFTSATFINNDFAFQPNMNLLDEETLLDSVSLNSTSLSTSGKTDDAASSCSSTPGSVSFHDPNNRGSIVSDSKKLKIPSLLQSSNLERGRRTIFRSKPLLVLRGHEGVVTELAWSKNLFLLVTSMDHQVRLWHISRRDCLCIFNHNDTVPTIVFHPKDDRYFLSGSLDGKLRLWNIPDKKVRFWVEVPVPSAIPVGSTSSSSSLMTTVSIHI